MVQLRGKAERISFFFERGARGKEKNQGNVLGPNTFIDVGKLQKEDGGWEHAWGFLFKSCCF